MADQERGLQQLTCTSKTYSASLVSAYQHNLVCESVVLHALFLCFSSLLLREGAGKERLLCKESNFEVLCPKCWY